MFEAVVEAGDEEAITWLHERLSHWGKGRSDIAVETVWWMARLEVYGQGQLASARRSLRRLIAQNPEHHRTDDALWLLADIYRRQGAWEQARRTYVALGAHRPNHGWAVGSERGRLADDAALMVGDIDLYVLRQPSAAHRSYASFLTRFSDSVLVNEAYFGLWLTYALLAQKAKAKRVLSILNKQELTGTQIRLRQKFRSAWPAGGTRNVELLRTLQQKTPKRVFSTLGPRPTRLR